MPSSIAAQNTDDSRWKIPCNDYSCPTCYGQKSQGNSQQLAPVNISEENNTNNLAWKNYDNTPFRLITPSPLPNNGPTGPSTIVDAESFYQGLNKQLVMQQVPNLFSLGQEYHDYLADTEIDSSNQQILKRYKGRFEAIKSLKNNKQITNRGFSIQKPVQNVLKEFNLDEYWYTHNSGNVVQHHLHGELLDIFSNVGNDAQYMALLKQRKSGKANQAGYSHTLEAVVDFADVARECNQKGDIIQGFQVADFCWSLLDYGKSYAKAAVVAAQQVGNGIQAVNDTLDRWEQNLDDFMTENDPTWGVAQGTLRATTSTIGIVRHPIEFVKNTYRTAVILSNYLGELESQRLYLKSTFDPDFKNYTPYCREYFEHDLISAAAIHLSNQWESDKKKCIQQSICFTTQFLIGRKMMGALNKHVLGPGVALVGEAGAKVARATRNKIVNQMAKMKKPAWLRQANEILKARKAAVNGRRMDVAIKIAAEDPNFFKAGAGTAAEQIEEAANYRRPADIYKEIEGTGERVRYVRPKSDLKVPEWADKKYEEIRKWTDDIERISQNTGMSPKKIERVKNHLFHEEHVLTHQKTLEDYIGRFGSDEEIAAAWDRLYRGDFIKNDIKLLEHEYFESRFERKYNVKNSIAHESTQKPKGRPWHANQYVKE